MATDRRTAIQKHLTRTAAAIRTAEEKLEALRRERADLWWEGTHEIEEPLTRDELADASGCTRAVVIRELQRMTEPEAAVTT